MAKAIKANIKVNLINFFPSFFEIKKAININTKEAIAGINAIFYNGKIANITARIAVINPKIENRILIIY